MKKKIALLIAVLLLITGLFTACGGTGSKNTNSKIKISKFNTTNLYDKKITHETLVAYDLTMINIFATWCNPCIEELPELTKVHSMLPKNVNLIGICGDAGDDAETLALAKEIVETNKVTFDVLIPDENLQSSIMANIDYYPTTLLFDSKGNLVTAPIEGVPDAEDVADAYLIYIHNVLDALGK